MASYATGHVYAWFSSGHWADPAVMLQKAVDHWLTGRRRLQADYGRPSSASSTHSSVAAAVNGDVLAADDSSMASAGDQRACNGYRLQNNIYWQLWIGEQEPLRQAGRGMPRRPGDAWKSGKRNAAVAEWGGRRMRKNRRQWRTNDGPTQLASILDLDLQHWFSVSRNLWSLTCQQSLFKRYHSEKQFSDFYLQDDPSLRLPSENSLHASGMCVFIDYLFCECCSHCRFQPYDRVIRFVE